MNKGPFNFLLNWLQFDDQTTRPSCKESEFCVPIKEIWNRFILNDNTNNKSGSLQIIDEQLLKFPGRGPFKKPARYELK